jgi:hypothetical protein
MCRSECEATGWWSASKSPTACIVSQGRAMIIPGCATIVCAEFASIALQVTNGRSATEGNVMISPQIARRGHETAAPFAVS